jgi:glutamine synthetase
MFQNQNEPQHFYDNKEDVINLFGSKVFNYTVMRKRLPKHIYKAMVDTVLKDLPLDENVAEVVASAMKDWAMEYGVTHFSHWFQPMTGITAEKHEAFISPTTEGKVIMEFSGKELIKGESDASSFPSGGLRATFEARGYTAWDPTSFAFIKGTTLCIPTTFVSFSGEILDKKTPLLRSDKSLSKEAVRILHLFGKTDVKKVNTNVGAEQEYFLIDRNDFKKRKDLTLTGRTLFGNRPPKGQEKDDHYYGRIRGRVHSFMCDLDRELWQLGIPSKTRHNESAPAQHELAPVYTNTNMATDNNQLIMEYMQKVAARHNFACLLHEKPFQGINGSGKHNNWSMTTNTGENLLNPGDTLQDNLQFLTFVTAFVEAVDRYPEMLRCTIATAGNDMRLGGSEAPPAILSIFLGEQLTAALESLETGAPIHAVSDLIMDLGIEAVPSFKIDNNDRNRTSPMAFTGNKFEFRMLGSNQSIAGPNIALNTMVAQVLREFADQLEGADNFEKALRRVLKNSIRNHKRVIFNGNNYTEHWLQEARKRGLPNLKSTPEAFANYCLDKNILLFENHNIYTGPELMARQEIHLSDYSETITIEARTMLTIAKREILPAALAYSQDIATGYAQKKMAGLEALTAIEDRLIQKLSQDCDELVADIDRLEMTLSENKDIANSQNRANHCHDTVIPAMKALRLVADRLESYVASRHWPFPIYEDILYYI